ncbi:unnamed protein product [Schistosoma spindalis]|nr:unnamed protein product [Schistosoma spindale]
MMFEYTSDYLAEKLRENWLTRNNSNEFIINQQEQDDSLTNLNWLQTLNIHEFTSTSSPISPPPTPPLHLIHSTNSVYTSPSSSSTAIPMTTPQMTTWNSSSQKFLHYKRNDLSLFHGIQHRNENHTLPYINYSKYRSTYNIHNNTDYTTDNHHHYISSIGITNKQYKDSPLKCLNNTINYYSNYNPIQLNHIPVNTITDSLQSNNNDNNSNIDYQQLLNTVYINTDDLNPIDHDQFSTNSIYDLHNNNNNNNVSNPDSSTCSLRNSNITRFEHQKLRKHDPQQQSMNLTDINFIINSSTTDIFNYNSSQVIYKKINNNTITTNNSTINYTNSINHNHNNTSIEDYYYYHITENNKLFIKYDTLSIQEKEIYQYNAYKKPLFNSHTLIYMAMNSLKKNKITFLDICDWIQLHFAFYRYQNDNYWWQDIIRKHLTCSRCFQRVPKRKEELDGRSDLWRINPELQNQLINNKISYKFLMAWKNQTLSKLPDLIDYMEQYNSILKLSSEINNDQHIDHNDPLIIINDNTNNNNNQLINLSKRKCINQLDNLIDYNQSSNIYLNIDHTTQSNSSSSPELSDLYTSSPSELLPESTTDLPLLIDNDYYLNNSLNSINFNDNIHNNSNSNNNNNNNDNVLRNNILHHSIHSSPLNLTEQDQCDLQALFNDHETHSILNDHFYYTSNSSISSFDLNNDNNNNSNNTNSNNNSNNNSNGLIVEELSKASGLNEIPPINDFDNDELIDPLDLTIHSVHSRFTNDWWSNHSNINNNNNNINHDSLTESMTNFINSTLNELEKKEKEENNDNDDVDDDGGFDDDELVMRKRNNRIDQRIDKTFTRNIINPIHENLILNNKQEENINEVKLHVNSLSSDLITNELSLSQTLSLLSSSSSSSSDLTILSPRLLSITNQTEMIKSSSSSPPPPPPPSTSLSSSSSSIPMTSSMISKINYYCKTSETNSIIINEDDAFFHQLQLNISTNKPNNNNDNNLIPLNHINDHNDIDEENINHNHNHNLLEQPYHQHWLDHKMNLDDLDNILGLH